MIISYSKLFVGISLPALCTGLASLLLSISADAQTIRPSTQKELKVFDPTTGYSGNIGIRAAAGTLSYTLTMPAAIPTANQVLSASAVTGGNVSLTWATPVSGTVTSVGLSVPTGFSVSSSPVTSAGTLSLSYANGYALPTTASQTNWDGAFSDRITAASVTGTTTKTITLTQQDGGTVTATFSDLNTDAVTSVFGRTGAVTSTVGDYTTAQVTEIGNLYYTDARARAAISLATTGSSGAATYSSTTGVLTIPNYTLTGLGGVGGSGTVNYLSKFATAGTLTNSLIFDNGANVGVGTATPSSTTRFEIRGTGTTSTTTALEVDNFNGSPLLVVRDDGAINIGTSATSPNTRVEILGNTVIRSPNSEPISFNLRSGRSASVGTSANHVMIGVYDSNNSSVGGISFTGGGAANKSRLNFFTAGGSDISNINNANMVIDQNGDVTIGNTKWLYGLNENAGSQPLIRSRGMGHFPSVYTGVQIGQAGDHIALGIDPGNVTGAAFAGNIVEVAMPNDIRFIQANSNSSNWLVDVLRMKNGNVGIGTASPNSKLDVLGGATFGIGVAAGIGGAADDVGFNPGNGVITIGAARGNGSNTLRQTLVLINGAASAAAETGATIDFVTGTNANASTLKAQIAGFGNTGNDKGFLAFYTRPNVNTLPTEKFRIDSDGNVGIGTASPSFRLVVEGAQETGAPFNGNKFATLGLIANNNEVGAGGSIEFGLRSSTTFAAIKGLGANGNDYTVGNLAFYTRAALADASMTERMRITYTGKVSVGDTDPIGRFEVKARSDDTEVLEIEDENENSLFRVLKSGVVRIPNLGSNQNTAVRINTDGTLTTGTSDARLKKNIQVIPNALQKVMGLRGVTYNWKDGRDTTRVLGMIAQEMLNVAPELVFQNNNGYYGIHYAETTGLLVEAIKEQQKIIEELKKTQVLMAGQLRQLQADLIKKEDRGVGTAPNQ